MGLWSSLRSSGQPLDEAAYTAAVGAFCRAGDVRVAEQLLFDSALDGLSPGVRMYNQLISAYGRQRDIAGVQRKVREMQEAGIPPNEATHGCLVTALIRCGDLERAWFALKARDSLPPARPYSPSPPPVATRACARHRIRHRAQPCFPLSAPVSPPPSRLGSG